MLDNLTKRFKDLWGKFSSGKELTEANLREVVEEIKEAFISADVHLSVTNQLVEHIEKQAIGRKIFASLDPRELFIKIVHEELVKIMGEKESSFSLKGSPAVWMLCGLQGSGKTTQAAKLAFFFKKQGKKVMVAACDLQRPAAIAQLETLCSPHQISVFKVEGEKDPCVVAKKALQQAKLQSMDLLILDTAGRLHIEENLMEELKNIQKTTLPQEILFVSSSAMGQQALRVAQDFNQSIGITGSILTMLDGDARGGAALSIKYITHKPLKFEGVGERIEDLQLFNPRSMADRILGMGDVVNLVKKAEEQFSKEEKEKLEEKLRKASFTYEDYLEQMEKMQRMGPLKNLLQMLPGMPDIPDMENSEEEAKKIKAIILSMTPQERQNLVEIVHRRRLRIAKGSGRSIDDVNKLVKNFHRMQDLMKNFKNKKQMKKLEQMTWR